MKKTTLVLILLLAGCAPTLEKPGASLDQKAADNMACDLEAMKATSGAVLGTGEYAMLKAQAWHLCMKLRGYRL